jgi:hypothetical protein
MIIGDKDEFAVEYSFSDDHPRDMGYGRIWVKNKFIGTFTDIIFLSGYLLDTLNEFKRAKELEDDLRQLTKDQLFDLLASGQYEQSNKYLVKGSTFTDDFSIWTYKFENQTYFLWRVMRTDFFEDLNNYIPDVFMESVPTDTLDKVINKLETEFWDKGILKVR